MAKLRMTELGVYEWTGKLFGSRGNGRKEVVCTSVESFFVEVMKLAEAE